MKRAIALLPYIPLRIEASERSEMVTQILFGETMDVLKESGNWSLVKLHFDGYQGWCDTKMFRFYDEEIASGSRVVLKRECKVTSDVGEMIISAGSIIRGVNKRMNSFCIEGQTYRLKQALSKKDFLETEDAIDLVMRMQGVPYLWGGRTVWGVDCSGLSQLYGRLMGMDMPRDARQQVDLGKDVMFLQDVKAGDLAFFGEDEKITHVGIVIQQDQILHASGQVRVDVLDQQGIFNLERKEYTHKLRVIKRLF